MHLFFKTKHFCPAIRPARLTAPSCIILATVLSLLFAACDYWGEDWYKNGESSTETAASTQAEAKNVLSAYMGLKGEPGQGASYIIGDDGKTITGHISLFAYGSSAEAESLLDRWKGYVGEAGTVTRSGNKIYVTDDFDSGKNVAEMFTEENGVYYPLPNRSYEKADGSGGLTGNWLYKDGSEILYEFEDNGTYKYYYNYTTTPPTYESGNWKSATGDVLSLLSAEGYDTSFYEGHTGKTGTYVFTRQYENMPWELEFIYADGKLYDGFTFPFIKKLLP